MSKNVLKATEIWYLGFDKNFVEMEMWQNYISVVMALAIFEMFIFFISFQLY